MIPPLDLGDEAGGGGDGEGEGLLLWQTQVADGRWSLRSTGSSRYDDNDDFDYCFGDKRWRDQLKTESEAQTSRDIELVVQEEADEGNQFSSPWTSSSLHHHHQICHHHHLYIIIISITIISIDITIKSINWHIRPQARSWKFSTRRRMDSLFPRTRRRRGCRHLLTTSEDQIWETSEIQQKEHYGSALPLCDLKEIIPLYNSLGFDNHIHL